MYTIVRSIVRDATRVVESKNWASGGFLAEMVPGTVSTPVFLSAATFLVLAALCGSGSIASTIEHELYPLTG